MNITQFEYTGYPSNVFFGENSFDKVSKLLSSYKKAFVIAGNRLEPYVDNLKKNLGEGTHCPFQQSRTTCSP